MSAKRGARLRPALQIAAPTTKKTDQAQRRRRHTSERQHLGRRDKAPASGSVLQSVLAPVAFLRDFVPSSQSDFEQRLLTEFGVDAAASGDSDSDSDSNSDSSSSSSNDTSTRARPPNKPPAK